MTQSKRRKQLIKPALQLRLILLFASGAASVAVLQAVLVNRALEHLAARASAEKLLLLEHMPTILTRSLLVSLAILIPLFLGIGIAITFRIAGPVYRFETYFRSLAEGRYTGPCKLRDTDALQGLCAQINRAVDRLRERPEDFANGNSSVDDVPAATPSASDVEDPASAA